MSLRLCSFFQFFLAVLHINDSTALCLIVTSIISILLSPSTEYFIWYIIFFVLKFSFVFFIVSIFAEKKIKFWLCHLRVLTFPFLMEHGYNSSCRVFYNSHFCGVGPCWLFFPSAADLIFLIHCMLSNFGLYSRYLEYYGMRLWCRVFWRMLILLF